MGNKGEVECRSCAGARSPGRRRLLTSSGLLVASALLPGVRRVATAEAPTALRIGVMGPFGGPASGTGRDIRQGIEMALDDAGAEGELPLLIDGRQRRIEPVWIDSRSDPVIAADAVGDVLARGEVELMFGGWHTAVALAVMEVEADLGMVHLGNVASGQAIADRLNADPVRYGGWFKGWPSPARLIPQYLEPLSHFRRQGLWRPASLRAAIVVEDTPWGESWGEAMAATLRRLDFEVQVADPVGLEQTDYRRILRHFRQQEVSFLAMTNSGNVAASSFVRQFREEALAALLVADSLRGSSDWYRRTGEASNYAICMDSAMPIALWQRWWVRRYQARYGQYPNIVAAGLHYDYMRMSIRALNAAASLDRERLIRTVHRTAYRGIWNLYRYARQPGAHAVSVNEVMTGRFMEGFYFPMVQLFDGESKIVWPLRYADMRFAAPPWTAAFD
ncbi:hypothetical protein GCM10011348_12550 [Marinobacterium nitratireducens]|uniref:Leucine-binding protein domain-containing protein n=1 Tax=Marinobacterium nitratireducens TaxID=518897 RepID=A0A918DPU5_9GAMM|nr:ABC transporter substrate-binding protein [Marinobacterium nitratireducens]GGO79099.1 hypothetical protein GCM10011348_12550 [Marinobacterium nitratireducens]